MNRPETPWNELLTDGQREAWIGALDEARMRVEWVKCQKSVLYFIDQYVSIYDKVAQRWIPFHLWPAQRRVLRDLVAYKLNNILKARQLGQSWLAIAFHGLFKSLFRPIAKVGIFSKRDDEAQYLLGPERLRGMYDRLPPFLQCRKVVKADGHTWSLSNGSVVRAFPTTAGDSYAMTDVLLDEFDLVPDQSALMRSVKPTVDGGGSMTMLSRADKSRPITEFKRTYRAGKAGSNGWNSIFLPWDVHPGRDVDWYAATRAEIEGRTGSLDELQEQYPATDVEALAPRSLDKRIAPQWLLRIYVPESADCDPRGAPAIPGLEVFRAPVGGRRYGIGVDPAEGNPTSDDSALEVVDLETGEEVCALAGKYEPSVTAAHADRLGRWYQNAALMVERNNHGHACLLWLKDHSPLKVLVGEDRRPGWLDNTRGKSLLYDHGADTVRDGDCVIHSERMYHQLSSIEGATLRAPEGQHDDRATAYVLALLIRRRRTGKKKARSFQG